MSQTQKSILLADIGGTNARFAVLINGEIGSIRQVVVADFPDAASAISSFLSSQEPRLDIVFALLGVAGPVEGYHCTITNSHWIIDGNELSRRFGFLRVRLINDFEAVAWSLPKLTSNDIYSIGGRSIKRDWPMVVIGPGTGLGVAALLEHVDGQICIATEAGHVSLAGSSRREDAIIDRFRGRFGHVSAERALSGPGLENLYSAIADVDGVSVPARRAAEITAAGLANTCAISRAALDMFCGMLGTLAGSFALTFRAQGGVFIAGGIVPRFTEFFSKSQFRARFEAMGRYQSYVQPIATSVILRPNIAFFGLKALAERQFADVSSAGDCNRLP
jgi:glucokinase